ncbi:calcium-dependent phosphotriesterase [Coemansia reversa NRRL 1564]|uniref:Calcium-dependent phosphotriesterase n=1 Tax=Coemansia reversa (strain ATCC 12441 / NRRL 1564) TaxID=763665 RepID=A0A2G5B793_COERN|nr:calcium-dependent phosphotriesterase [Coemansia reversa NRRL 1564]|eukprot:PIA14896.1 calcium-dependent phosphotriesterase [Coemansia reversa NRRL 1564]
MSVAEQKVKSVISAADSMFGPAIEGVGVDKVGNIYAVNFKSDLTMAGLVAEKQALFYQATGTDEEKQKIHINGIRFNIGCSGAEEAYIADAGMHQVYRLTQRQSSDGTFKKAKVFCGDKEMLQPNDIAIAPSSGRIFLSGMNYNSDTQIGDGDLWTCDKKGKATKLGQFYRTNGIEISPDEKTLYLSEAQNSGGTVIGNRILAFDLDASSGAVTNKRTFVNFGDLDDSAAIDIDGMRTDTDGNLYVTRNGLGKVAIFSSTGELTAYISLPSIVAVTSLEFGGSSGSDLYMVGKCKEDENKGCVDVYSSTAKGRAYNNLQGN